MSHSPMRTRRAYLDHKVDLGTQAAVASDQAIRDSVDDITALLLRGMAHALGSGNYGWLPKFDWFVGLIEALADERPGQPLDG
jgi:hypothetical protein